MADAVSGQNMLQKNQQTHMKIFYPKEREDVVFGLKFIKTIDSFEEAGAEMSLNVQGNTTQGLREVLLELKKQVGDERLKNIYLSDSAIEKTAKLLASLKSVDFFQLRQLNVGDGFSIYDTVFFANAYRHLCENKKVGDKDMELFLSLQEKLCEKLDFIKYAQVNIELADIRVGEIVEIRPVDNSDKLFVEKVVAHKEFQVVSGLRKHYSEDALLNKKFLFILNMKPVALAGVKSEGMILCGSSDEKVSAIEVRADIMAGSRLELDIVGCPVVRNFERPVFDPKKGRAKDFLHNLHIKEHRLYFGVHKVLCAGSEVACDIENGPVG